MEYSACRLMSTALGSKKWLGRLVFSKPLDADRAGWCFGGKKLTIWGSNGYSMNLYDVFSECETTVVFSTVEKSMKKGQNLTQTNVQSGAEVERVRESAKLGGS